MLSAAVHLAAAIFAIDNSYFRNAPPRRIAANARQSQNAYAAMEYSLQKVNLMI